MSVEVMTQIWNSGLERDEKSILVSLADLGNTDGLGIYPSLEYTAWRTGYSLTAVKDILAKCKEKGYITWVRDGSIYGTNEYKIHRDRLPGRPPWKPRRNSRISAVTPETVIAEIRLSNSRNSATIR